MGSLTTAARAALNRARSRAARLAVRTAPTIVAKNKVGIERVSPRAIANAERNIEFGRQRAIQALGNAEDIGRVPFKPAYIDRTTGEVKPYTLTGLNLTIEDVPTRELVATAVRDTLIKQNVRNFQEWVTARFNLAKQYDLPIEITGTKKEGFLDLPLPDKSNRIFRVDRKTGIGGIIDRNGEIIGNKYRYNFEKMDWEKLPDNYVEKPLLRTVDLIGEYWLNLERPTLQFEKLGGRIIYFR